jgi:dCTP deaminase
VNSKSTSNPPSILVHQQIAALVARGAVSGEPAIGPSQIQPASLDLRLGRRGYRIRTGFLPESATVDARLQELTLYDFDLDDGAILEKGHCYMIPLLERLALPTDLVVRSNPKSSTGRLDIFTRLLADRCPRFEMARAGYQGPLYLEVVPRSFSIRVATGLSLNQIRFIAGEPMLNDQDLADRYAETPLLFGADGRPLSLQRGTIDGGLCMGVALAKDRDLTGPIGYRARRLAPIVDLTQVGGLDPERFFEAIPAPTDGRFIVEPEEFYLFASKERVRIPKDLAAEMAPYDVGIGELRTNYAGFFDNGFGEPAGTRAVLEVRPHDVPFLVEDGQVFFKLQFFKTSELPAVAYGDGALTSHYQGQGLKLSKHFRAAAQ